MNPTELHAVFQSIDFDEHTVTFRLAPEDINRFRWKAGAVVLDVAPITVPVDACDESCPCGSGWVGIGVCPDCGREHGRIL
jgi:hypothetical protein